MNLRTQTSTVDSTASSQDSEILRGWPESALDLLFPPWCQICRQHRASKQMGFVCSYCQAGLRWLEPPFCNKCALPYAGDVLGPFQCANCQDVQLAFEWARSSLVNTPTLLDIVHRYKYQGHRYFAPLLKALFVAKAARELNSTEWNSIVPVPLHAVRLREREFNQAEELAKALGNLTGIPVNAHWLSRVQNTRTQTTLGRDERRANVNKAFKINHLEEIKGSRIVVVDDILTTGSTTHACAKALRHGGASRVVVWTLARGLVGHSAVNLNLSDSRIDSGLGHS